MLQRTPSLRKVKRELTKLDKVFTNRISHNGLVSRICKELLQVNNKSQITQFFKWVKSLHRFFFSTEDIQMANKHVKKCSTPVFIRKMKVKATMRYHFIFTKIVILKKKNRK